MDSVSKEDTIFNLLYPIFKRKRTVLGIFLATVFFIMFFTYLVTPTWEGTALILVEANPKRQLTAVPDLSTPGRATSPEIQVHNLVPLLSGRNMAYEIVEEFELDDRLYRRKVKPETARDVIKKAMVDLFRSPVLFLRTVRILRAPQRDWVDEAADDLIDKAQDIEVEERTQVINLTIRGETPELAAGIANRMAELFQEKLVALSLDETRIVYEFTEAEIENTREKLEQARANLREFLEENEVFDIQEERRHKVLELEALKIEHLRTRNGKEVLVALLDETNRQLRERNPLYSGSPLASENPVILHLRSELSRAEVQLASALTEKTEKHPDVIRIETEIKRIKELLSLEITKMVTGKSSSDEAYTKLLDRAIELEFDLATADDKMSGLENSIDELESDLQLLPAREMELASLSNEVAAYEATERGLRARLEELRVLSNMEVDETNLRIVERAHVSPLRKPDWPKTTVHFIVSLFLGALIGIGYVLFIEYWDNSFRRPKEVEETLGVPVIGNVSPQDGEE